MEKSAIIFEKNRDYIYHLQDDIYEVKILTKRDDIESVEFLYNDKYFNKDGHLLVPSTSLILLKKYITNYHDVFMGRFCFTGVAMSFYFRLKDKKGQVINYGAYHFFNDIFNVNNMFDAVPYLLKADTFKFPKWSVGGKIYQIFVERFAPTNEYSKNWFEPTNYFSKLNGTLKGITKNLGYIKNLGMDAIYMTPIFKSPTNHKYDVEDYYTIDSNFGNRDDLLLLVEKAHELDLKVIIDLVFNHTSTNFFAFQDLLLNQEKSQYKNWYIVSEYPVKIEENPKYKCFSRVKEMPKLNTANEEVQNYLIDVALNYIQYFKIDGIRMDVADEIDLTFLRRLRKKVKSYNENIMIYGEIWFDSASYLQGDIFDSVMNYQFYSNVFSLINHEITADEFGDNIDIMYSRVHLDVQNELLNLISSHDTERACSRLNYRYDLLKIAFSLMYLTKGSLMIYYGEEKCLGGCGSEDNRRGMIFKENDVITPLVRNLSEIKEIASFKRGDYHRILLENKNILMFDRYVTDEKYRVVLNMGNDNFELENEVFDIIDKTKVKTLKPNMIIAFELK